MSFDLHKIWQSKRALRERLRALPVAEKLRMLDAMRESFLSIRAATKKAPRARLHGRLATYRDDS
jgi:hypothetical protein